MRTTLTLDDDIAKILQSRARELDKPFKEVINATLRAGLAKENVPVSKKPPPRVVARNLGLKAGIDPDKLNQLVDELEAEEFASKHPRP